MTAPSFSFGRIWMAAIVLAVFLLGLIAVAAATGWREAWAAVQTLTFGQFCVLLALSLANYGFRAARWRVYTQALGIPTTMATDLCHYLGGFAMTVTPGRVGELVRLRWIWRDTGKRPDSTASIMIADRAADLVAVGLLLALSIAASAAGLKGAWTVSAMAIIMAAIATRPKLLRLILTLGWRVTGIFPRIFAGLRRAASGLSQYSRPAVFLPATALGVAGWAAEGLAFYLLLMWLGADVSILAAFAVFFFSMLTGGATGLPGGIGGAEAAMIAALALIGVPFEIALPATAIIRLTTLWFAILVGVAVFPFAERSTPASLREA